LKDDLNLKKDFKLAYKETIAMQKKLTGYIILLFVILFGFILPSCRAQQEQDIIALSPKEASSLIEKHRDDSDFVILDIRTPGEYQSGHLKDSIMIDYYSKSFVDEIGRLDKNKSYLVYCRSGNRSARSMALFKKLQFQKIYHLSAGINGWNSEGLPVVK
jgi:rhodanese-related sulfurtransferase